MLDWTTKSRRRCAKLGAATRGHARLEKAHEILIRAGQLLKIEVLDHVIIKLSELLFLARFWLFLLAQAHLEPHEIVLSAHHTPLVASDQSGLA